MANPDPRREEVQERLGALTSNFDYYVDAYDERVSFTTRQLRLHRQTIALRSQANGVGEAIDNDDFLRSLRSTLRAWGLGVRRSKLAPDREFDEAIRSVRAQIEALDGLLIDDPALPVDVGELIWRVIESIEVVDNRAKLVAGTKTLHHLLPDLVVPMDHRPTSIARSFRHIEPSARSPVGLSRTSTSTVAIGEPVARRSSITRSLASARSSCRASRATSRPTEGERS